MWFPGIISEYIEKCTFKIVRSLVCLKFTLFSNCIPDTMLYLRHIVDMVCGKNQ